MEPNSDPDIRGHNHIIGQPAKHRISTGNILPAVIYIFINALFVWKYAADYLQYPLMLSLIYIVIITIAIYLTLRGHRVNLSKSVQNKIYFSVVFLSACVLTIIMLQFDPARIAVGRYPAMYEWITRLLSGEFPYASSANPSGFPFLFILAIPFYILGDLGFFQIFSFLVFALVIHLSCSKNDLSRFRSILLLIAAPIFLFEIVVRSDLFSNMVMVMLYLLVFQLYGRERRSIFPVLLGLAGGLLLSTRGVVFIIYIIFFIFMVRENRFRYGLFISSMLAGFILTLAPFLIWDAKHFVESGPFAIQLSYIPVWVFILSIIASIACGLGIKTLKSIYTSISVMLFGIVLIAFVLSIINFGLTESVLGDRFDISYFSFCLPFLLMSLTITGEARLEKAATVETSV